MSVPYHDWTHRPASRGGTDPVEIILPYGEWSRSSVMPSDGSTFTGAKAFGFEGVRRYEPLMYDIESGGAVDEAGASISDDGAGIIAAPGLYLVFISWRGVTPNNNTTVMDCALYSRYPSGSFVHQSNGAPFMSTPMGLVRGPHTGDAGAIYWFAVGHTNTTNKLWLKPVVTITGTADSVGGMTMAALRVSDDTPMLSKSS